MPPPARNGRNRERTVRGRGSGGARVAALQAEDPAGRAAEQPSRRHQRRGGARVTPSDGRGARARGGPRPALSETSGPWTGPRIWTGGRKHGRAMRHRVDPKPAGSKPKTPVAAGGPRPTFSADYRQGLGPAGARPLPPYPEARRAGRRFRPAPPKLFAFRGRGFAQQGKEASVPTLTRRRQWPKSRTPPRRPSARPSGAGSCWSRRSSPLPWASSTVR